MDANDIQPGIVITGPFWPEPVEVKKSEIFGQDVEIIVSEYQAVSMLIKFYHLNN